MNIVVAKEIIKTHQPSEDPFHALLENLMIYGKISRRDTQWWTGCTQFGTSTNERRGLLAD